MNYPYIFGYCENKMEKVFFLTKKKLDIAHGHHLPSQCKIGFWEYLNKEVTIEVFFRILVNLYPPFFTR